MADDKLKKLQKLLEVVNEGLTRKEFLAAFQKVLDHVLGIDAKTQNSVNKTINGLKDQLKTLLSATQSDINDLKAKQVQSNEEHLKVQINALNFIRDKVKKIKEGKDGEPGIGGKDGAPGTPGKDADEEKIIKEVIKKTALQLPDNLVQREELLETIRKNKLIGGGFSKIAMEGKLVDAETPTGTINGSNTAFVAASIPNPTASLKVFVNGARMSIAASDYTVSGATITFTTAPPTNSNILIDYRK